MTTNYNETTRKVITLFEDVLLPVEGDNYAFTYRLEPDLHIPELWCRLDWITDIQLKKLCEEALLEKDKTRHSFKYDDYWWTVIPDKKGAKVFRETEERRKMFFDEANEHKGVPMSAGVIVFRDTEEGRKMLVDEANENIPKIPMPAEFRVKES